jgi:hypothetical protein
LIDAAYTSANEIICKSCVCYANRAEWNYTNIDYETNTTTEENFFPATGMVFDRNVTAVERV